MTREERAQANAQAAAVTAADLARVMSEPEIDWEAVADLARALEAQSCQIRRTAAAHRCA